MSTDTIAAPAFLVEAMTYTQGCEKIALFLDKTVLIKYDNVTFSQDRSCSGTEPSFWAMIDGYLVKNNRNIVRLINELQESGYNQLSELTQMKQGYASKTLHILVHLLDGFIGIDSSFYNLIEDSHQISDTLRRKIKQTPDHYQLLQVEAENPQTFL